MNKADVAEHDGGGKNGSRELPMKQAATRLGGNNLPIVETKKDPKGRTFLNAIRISLDGDLEENRRYTSKDLVRTMISVFGVDSDAVKGIKRVGNQPSDFFGSLNMTKCQKV